VVELAVAPWLFGFFGAFMYAAPRWVIKLSATDPPRMSALLCSVEMLIALLIGAMAGGMFGNLAGQLVLTTFHLKSDNAVCGLIGLFANRVAPDMVEKGSVAFNGGAALVGRVLKALKGDEK
jgi:hypothetical protein